MTAPHERLFLLNRAGERHVLPVEEDTPLSEDDLRRLLEAVLGRLVDSYDLGQSVVALPVVFVERVLADLSQSYRALTAAQERGTALLEENRELRAQAAARSGVREGYAPR